MSSPRTELSTRVALWLETQGYPLEMRVAQAFQALGATVVQSDYYKDTTSGDSRETDVVAIWSSHFAQTFARVTFIVECKSSREKPWVLFSAGPSKLPPSAGVSRRAASAFGRHVLEEVSDEVVAQVSPLFELPRTTGYGLTQAFTSGHDVCYTAASAVASATSAYIARSNHIASNVEGIDLFEIFFPVLVTEAPLMEAFLRSDGSLSVQEIGSGTLLWRNPLVGTPQTVIQIITLGSFSTFVNQASAAAKDFLALCSGPLLPKIEVARSKYVRARTSAGK